MVSPHNTLFRVAPKISKKLLNEDDYPAWSVEVTRQLRRQRLLDIADGTKPRPEDGNGDEQAKWDAESDRANFDHDRFDTNKLLV